MMLRSANPSSFLSRHTPSALVLASLAVFTSGCAEKRSRAVPWATAIQVRPSAASYQPFATSQPPGTPPEFVFEIAAPPLGLEGARREPPRPRVPTPAQPENEANHADADDSTPLLAPQLTAQELAMAQQQTSESLGIAEHNLQRANSRTLNAVQSDLVAKVSSFVAQSRQAAGEHDWIRASNLAKKAEVLSEELANSL
jgi:hypothetical protein